MRDAVIVDAVRTPIGKGKPGGSLSGLHPVDLHAHAIRFLIERSGIDPAVVDDVISGAVGQIGEQSSNTARWAALAAGLPESVPAVTVDRQGCSRGLLRGRTSAVTVRAAGGKETRAGDGRGGDKGEAARVIGNLLVGGLASSAVTS